MKIGIIYSGPFGEQMINNMAKRFASEIVCVYELSPEMIEEEHPSEPDLWSKIWENPEEYVPKSLLEAECDLMLVLGIHPKLGDLIPPIAERLKAKAVIYPIDDRKMIPEAKKSIQDTLEEKGIHVEFPEPFCILERSRNELVNEFIKHFGRPKFEGKLDEGKKVIKELKVIRDTPCGTATHLSQVLKNFPYDDREALIKKIYDEHHNEEAESHCLAEMDPIYPLMQEAGDLVKDAIFEALGFPTTKDLIVEKVKEKGEIGIEELKKILVGEPGDWKNPEKACDADRTFNLYLEELVEEGKIVRAEDGKLRLP